MPRQTRLWLALILTFACFGGESRALSEEVVRGDLPTDFGEPASLPLPHTLSRWQYETRLFEFVNSRAYVKLGWINDKKVRDTGPWIQGKYYGTHPAVRIYYSPEIIRWLVGGRVDSIPDGAMIIKEQYPPPAARHDGADESQLWQSLSSWTIMVKDTAGSHDGWFWSNPAKDQKPVDSHSYPFEEPISGFGLYCVRCHASAQSPGRFTGKSTNEYTFAALRNIRGFPGEPLAFRVDDSWREPEPKPNETKEDLSNELKLAEVAAKPSAAHPRCTDAMHPERCITRLNEDFLKAFPSIPRQSLESVRPLPPMTHDSVPRSAPASAMMGTTEKASEQGFITSNQCMSCHAGITEPFGPTMFVPTGESAEYGEPGLHVSPYGEWRWTPMGLAGRDPVFFAQLDSELEMLKQEFDAATAKSMGEQLVHTCMGCHGVMGRRQFEMDHPHKEKFSLDFVYAYPDHKNPGATKDSHYGALARDGISCVVCHRMQPQPQAEGDSRPYLQHFLTSSITGNFHLGKSGELYGPYKDQEIAPYAMEHAIGFKPKQSEFIKSSQMCGSCHTVNLPSVDKPHAAGHETDELIQAEPNPLFKKFHHHVEQATYLEWLNSEFENEYQTDNPKAKTCQECHMSRGVHDEKSGTHINQLQTRIAAIQDETYPEAENIASPSELNVRYRKEGYARHNFKGLNVFLLEMFRQFDDVLGVRRVDYMTGSNQDIPFALNDFVRQAQSMTANVQLKTGWLADGKLEAIVKVENLTGHRFPTGVGFRRAFVELAVYETTDENANKLVWASGRTNRIGQIIDQSGKPLLSESYARDQKYGALSYQAHHETITDPAQVQIYETLVCDAKQRLTTSFIHGCEVVKDNRLLPRGWRADGTNPALTGAFLKRHSRTRKRVQIVNIKTEAGQISHVIKSLCQNPKVRTSRWSPHFITKPSHPIF